jgi:hypothetical protein
MNKPFPPRDPGAAHLRKVNAARRIGVGARCACGESRPEALICKGKRIICAACDREKKGKSTVDYHHPFGKANNSTTMPVWVNDHRADLSAAQYDWPKKTRENPDSCPLRAAAGCIRGFVDTIVYLIEKGLLWIADALEWLSRFLLEQMGSEWWLGTPLEQLAPRR